MICDSLPNVIKLFWFLVLMLLSAHSKRFMGLRYAGFSLNRPHWADSVLQLPCPSFCFCVRDLKALWVGCVFQQHMVSWSVNHALSVLSVY